MLCVISLPQSRRVRRAAFRDLMMKIRDANGGRTSKDRHVIQDIPGATRFVFLGFIKRTTFYYVLDLDTCHMGLLNDVFRMNVLQEASCERGGWELQECFGGFECMRVVRRLGCLALALALAQAVLYISHGVILSEIACCLQYVIHHIFLYSFLFNPI